MWRSAVGNKTDAKAKMVNDEVCTNKSKFPPYPFISTTAWPKAIGIKLKKQQKTTTTA